MLTWTDTRRPVPRLWIRSAEVRGKREHNNKRNNVKFKINYIFHIMTVYFRKYYHKLQPLPVNMA